MREQALDLINKCFDEIDRQKSANEKVKLQLDNRKALLDRERVELDNEWVALKASQQDLKMMTERLDNERRLADGKNR